MFMVKPKSLGLRSTIEYICTENCNALHMICSAYMIQEGNGSYLLGLWNLWLMLTMGWFSIQWNHLIHDIYQMDSTSVRV